MTTSLQHTAIVILLATFMAACNPTTNSSIIPGKSQGYHPIPNDRCEQFRTNTALVLNLETNAKVGPFKNSVTGEEGKACIIQAKATGLNFANLVDVMRLLRPGLFSTWMEERSYQADGPASTSTAFSQANRLAIVNISWNPTPEAKCPVDQVISACPLTPEQKLYTITIQAVQK